MNSWSFTKTLILFFISAGMLSAQNISEGWSVKQFYQITPAEISDGRVSFQDFTLPFPNAKNHKTNHVNYQLMIGKRIRGIHELSAGIRYRREKVKAIYSFSQSSQHSGEELINLDQAFDFILDHTLKPFKQGRYELILGHQLFIENNRAGYNLAHQAKLGVGIEINSHMNLSIGQFIKTSQTKFSMVVNPELINHTFGLELGLKLNI